MEDSICGASTAQNTESKEEMTKELLTEMFPSIEQSSFDISKLFQKKDFVREMAVKYLEKTEDKDMILKWIDIILTEETYSDYGKEMLTTFIRDDFFPFYMKNMMEQMRKDKYEYFLENLEYIDDPAITTMEYAFVRLSMRSKDNVCANISKSGKPMYKKKKNIFRYKISKEFDLLYNIYIPIDSKYIKRVVLRLEYDTGTLTSNKSEFIDIAVWSQEEFKKLKGKLSILDTDFSDPTKGIPFPFVIFPSISLIFDVELNAEVSEGYLFTVSGGILPQPPRVNLHHLSLERSYTFHQSLSNPKGTSLVMSSFPYTNKYIKNIKSSGQLFLNFVCKDDKDM